MEPKLRILAALALALAAVAIVGSSLAFDASGEPAAAGASQPQAGAATEHSGFSWLRPSELAPRWRALGLPSSPARLPLPPGWRVAAGDPGTRSAELRGPDGEIAGYLNATPRQGPETLANWTRFRIEHNREEGDRQVRRLAAARGLRFGAGAGSCVLDSYRTASGNRYREIACIVAGRSATTVIVAAAPPRRWAAERGDLRRAVNAFRT